MSDELYPTDGEELLLKPNIRDVRTQDFDSIFKINQEAAPQVFVLDDHELSLLHKLCEYSKVIEIDGIVAGYIFVLGRGLVYDGDEYNWFCENFGESFLYIDQIAIGKRWKGNGFGAALYEHLSHYADRHQISALTFEVNYKPLNQESMDFHKRMGFSETNQMEARNTIVSLLISRNSRIPQKP